MSCKLLENYGMSRERKANYDTSSKGGTELLEAKEIARRFLQQIYSTVIFKEATLKENVWMVTMDVGLYSEHIARVRVDANTGRIVGYI